MSFLQGILSFAAASFMMFSVPLKTIAPQNNIDGTLFLVNKQWTISETYVPETVISQVPGQVRSLRADAAAALEEMFAACKEETGITLTSVSGYRSWSKQNRIYQRKLRSVKKDVAKAEEYVAPPGASEHHLALAMDIGQRNKKSLVDSFGLTKGGQWARENCWRFGFILRYDEPWESVTGYKYEPWHFRYVGKEYAQQIYNAGIPFETWLANHRTDIMKQLLSE